MADDRKLRPEARVRPVANDGCIEEQTDDGIEESEKDCRQSWQVGPSSLRGRPVPHWEFRDGTGVLHEYNRAA